MSYIIIKHLSMGERMEEKTALRIRAKRSAMDDLKLLASFYETSIGAMFARLCREEIKRVDRKIKRKQGKESV